MKNRIIVVSCLLALMLSSALFGCSAGGGTNPADAYVGNWELESVGNGEDGSLSTEDVQMMKDMGLTCKLNLTADGAASLDMFGDVTSGTWETTDKGAKIVMESGESELAVSEGKLTFGTGAEQLTFVKADAASSSADAGAAASAAASADAAASATADEGNAEDGAATSEAAEGTATSDAAA